MAFDVQRICLHTDSLSLDYYSVPWDSELLGRPAAQLENLDIRNGDGAQEAFSRFEDWKRTEGIQFVTARAPHHDLAASWLVQSRGYRFVELNYRPRASLDRFADSSDDGLRFLPAEPADRDQLCQYAGMVFENTRFHVDTEIGIELANRRYATWMSNAFLVPEQEVIKCERDGALVAFFVQQYPAPGSIFWSLVGLAPGLGGRGLGFKVWSNALGWLARRGAREISTSISSLNTPVFNLYVKLGFAFPAPESIFHWHANRGQAV